MNATLTLASGRVFNVYFDELDDGTKYFNAGWTIQDADGGNWSFFPIDGIRAVLEKGTCKFVRLSYELSGLDSAVTDAEAEEIEAWLETLDSQLQEDADISRYVVRPTVIATRLLQHVAEWYPVIKACEEDGEEATDYRHEERTLRKLLGLSDIDRIDFRDFQAVDEMTAFLLCVINDPTSYPIG